MKTMFARERDGGRGRWCGEAWRKDENVLDLSEGRNALRMLNGVSAHEESDTCNRRESEVNQQRGGRRDSVKRKKRGQGRTVSSETNQAEGCD
jgi:hypothetical protein